MLPSEDLGCIGNVLAKSPITVLGKSILVRLCQEFVRAAVGSRFRINEEIVRGIRLDVDEQLCVPKVDTRRARSTLDIVDVTRQVAAYVWLHVP